MKKRLIGFGIILILIIVICVLYSRYIEPYHFVTKEIKIEANIPSNFDGFKVVHISDLYYGSTINKDKLDDIVNEINLLKPDIVVLTGNLFDNSINLSVEEYDNLTNELSNISANIGKFAIKGNKDTDTKWNDIITNSGFVDLDDTYNLLYDNGDTPIIISGISTNLDGSSISDKIAPIDTYINSLSTKPYSILLMHEPDYIDDINTSNYDLILAGNSKQVNLPFLNNINLNDGSKKYTKDHYKVNNSDLYINNGLGTTKMPYRFMSAPTINFYRIVKK